MPSEKCGRCGGSKEIIKLGLMRGPCDHCDAKGYIITDNRPADEPIKSVKRKPKYPLIKESKVNGQDPPPKEA